MNTNVNLDELLVGAELMASDLFCTPEPTSAQIRQVRYWLASGHLKTRKIGGRYVCTRRDLRAQVTLDAASAVAA
jgi:hypothetical protein